MTSNLDRFKGDLERLIKAGNSLSLAMKLEIFPAQTKKSVKKSLGNGAEALLKSIPSFREDYQRWYSEGLALLRQLLPDRVADFVRHYEKPKPRKEINPENYRIDDYLQGVFATKGWEKEKVVGPDAAIPHFQQQLAILKAAQARFESSLFEIKQLLQADLFDSELEAAEELAKHKFVRAAGAVAGVVLERHLSQVCQDRSVSTNKKKHPCISDFNDSLKTAGVLDIPEWRFIQHLGDIRNLCDHSKKPEPTNEQVVDLIAGVKKVIKTVH